MDNLCIHNLSKREELDLQEDWVRQRSTLTMTRFLTPRSTELWPENFMLTRQLMLSILVPKNLQEKSNRDK